MTKATWISPIGGNDLWWRAEAPAEVIGAKVIKVPEDELDYTFLHPNLDSSFPWVLHAFTDDPERILPVAEYRITSKSDWEQLTLGGKRTLSALEAVFPEVEGAVVMTRPSLAQAVLAQAMRRQGIRTVAETDDNYFAPAGQNIFTRHSAAENRGTYELMKEQHAKAMADAGVNVFSTAALRDRYHKEYRERFGSFGLPEMYVCRNHVPSYAWPDIPAYDGPVRVGFMGSPSHLWDISIAYAAFHAASFHKCHTVVIGYNPQNPDPHIPDEFTAEDGTVYQLRSKKSRRVSARWAAVIKEHIPWIKPDEYHRTPLPLDIGLAPLRKNDFTLGKSDAKALEYTISGAACVLMKHPIYTDAGWVHGENCLLAKSQEEMGLHTLRLIREPHLRRRLVTAAQEMVRNERNEKIMREEWLAAVNG